MQALHVSSHGVLELEDVPDPVAGPGRALVRVHVAGVNPIDAMVRSGARSSTTAATGWDFAGTVVAVGADVDPARVGQRVAGLTVAMVASSGGHAQLVSVPADHLAVIPDDLRDAEAATFALNGLTAEIAAEDAEPLAGRRVLVTGAAGAVGANVLAELRDRGVRADALARESDRDLVEGLGATLVTSLGTATHDVVIDAAAMREPARDAVVDGGRYVDLIGLAPLSAERGITVTAVGVAPNGERLRRLLEQAAAGRRPIRVAQVLPLADWERAFAAIATPGRRGAVLLDPR